MKRKIEKGQKTTRGLSSAVLLSILIHAALFLLAGMLVVFTVVRQKEVEFAPPKAVDRPKMKLKKPKVKVRKTSKPKPTTHIVSKVQKANMPDIRLPEISSMGEGLAGGLGGFDLMPDLGEPTLLGSSQSIGNDFEGTFYDFKRDRSGRNIPIDSSGIEWSLILNKFFKRGWDTAVFSRYYRAPKKLYATSLIVPIRSPSVIAPLAFGDENAAGGLWAVHYKGQLVCPVSHTNGITFRFWASSSGGLTVRVDGKVVMAAAWGYLSRHAEYYYRRAFDGVWNSNSNDSYRYYLGNAPSLAGDWITLEPGVPLAMEILIGSPSTQDAYYLAIEEEGVEYERNRDGAPILPIFKTAELSHEQLDAIYSDLNEDEMVCLTNGPVFCDYDTSSRAVATNTEPAIVEPAVPADSAKEEIRTWTLADGRTLEAEFINIFGGKVVLKNTKGKVCRIPKERFSVGDVEYAELADPPDIDINFLKSFKYVEFSGGFYDIWGRSPEEWGHLGIQLKQTSAGEYDHELKVEMFVVGKQWRRSKYILLDYQTTFFNPAREDHRFLEFRSGRKVVIALREYYELTFGEKYDGYLVTVTDERGKMIAMKSSHKWIPKILGNLGKLSVGNFFDETGMRTYPDRPPKTESNRY